MVYYICAAYYYILYLLNKYLIRPFYVFILFYFPSCLIFNFDKYIDLDVYDAFDDIKHDGIESVNINCNEQQIYVEVALLLDTSLTNQIDITNKIVLLGKIQNRLNLFDLIQFCIKSNNKKYTHLYIRYTNVNNFYINKYININDKMNIITNKRLPFGNICE